MLTEKDKRDLINLPNKALQKFGSLMSTRCRIQDVPESIISFYEENREKINGDVVVVRNNDDEGYAAQIRNSGRSALFIFSEEHYVTSYFSGTTDLIKFSKALCKRASV